MDIAQILCKNCYKPPVLSRVTRVSLYYRCQCKKYWQTCFENVV